MGDMGDMVTSRGSLSVLSELKHSSFPWILLQFPYLFPEGCRRWQGLQWVTSQATASTCPTLSVPGPFLITLGSWNDQGHWAVSDPYLQGELGGSFTQGASDPDTYSQNNTSDYCILEKKETMWLYNIFLFEALIYK